MYTVTLCQILCTCQMSSEGAGTFVKNIRPQVIIKKQKIRWNIYIYIFVLIAFELISFVVF